MDLSPVLQDFCQTRRAFGHAIFLTARDKIGPTSCRQGMNMVKCAIRSMARCVAQAHALIPQVSPTLSADFDKTQADPASFS